MGTTLTGTTPQDTYDSLIKVTDNGPLSGTLKLLSDGLGNDSALALSTSITAIRGGQQLRLFRTDNAIYGSIQYLTGTGGFKFDDANGDGFTFAQGANTRLAITSAGNVGIGTSTANFILEAAGTTGIGVRSTGVDGVYTDILSSVYSGNANEQNAIQASVSGVASDSGFRFQVSNGSGLSTQTVGYQLNKDRHIFYANGSERVRVTTDGLTFNGDTAAANALDDYEEGTWTMGISFGGASVGVTYGVNTGSYTKIGRQVTANGLMTLSSKGSSTGAAFITGLPFTIASGNSNYAAVSLRFDSITFTNQFQAYGGITSTNIELEEITLLGAVSALTNADFANACSIMVSATYFV